MTHGVLEILKSDEFALALSFISIPRAVHRALQRNENVKDLRSALQRGEVTEDTLRVFTADLLRELQYGKRFPHELALAAICVALETWSTPFAEEFVLDLARLELAELPIAIRVAREACQEQLKLPGNRTKAFPFSDQVAFLTEWQCAAKPQQVMVGQSEQSFAMELA